LARIHFFRKKRTKREWRRTGSRSRRGPGHTERRHDSAERRRRDGPELGDDLLRLALGGAEEPRHDLAAVLGRDDLRELDDAREVEAPIAEGLDDLRVPPEQLGRGLPVERRPVGEPELAGEEVEEGGVPQLDPAALAIERGEGDEEVRESVVLAAQEVGKVRGGFARGRHEGDRLIRFRSAVERAHSRSGATARVTLAHPSGESAAARAGAAETSSGRSRRGRRAGSEIRAEPGQAPGRVAAKRGHQK
jgi:hypothetical protein